MKCNIVRFAISCLDFFISRYLPTRRPPFACTLYDLAVLLKLTLTVICVDPAPDADGVPYKPWRFRDSPLAIEAKAAESSEETGSASMNSATFVILPLFTTPRLR